jgi:hypothetical protein
MAYDRSMPATGGTFTTLPTDAPVFTADGDKLGTVREVRGDAFKVDAPMQPDYWLPFSSIATAGADGVRLGFAKDHLGDFKLKD